MLAEIAEEHDLLALWIALRQAHDGQVQSFADVRFQAS